MILWSGEMRRAGFFWDVGRFWGKVGEDVGWSGYSVGKEEMRESGKV